MKKYNKVHESCMQLWLYGNTNIEIYTGCATTCATEGDSRRVALSMYTALLTAAFGVDKKMLPENPLKHEMKLLKFEHNGPTS